MAIKDSTQVSFRQRILAVLDYDGIPEHQRINHVAKAGKVSRSTARRILSGSYDIAKSRGLLMFTLGDGLNVHWRWIFDGRFDAFDPRTARIQLVMIEGEDKEQVELNIGSISSEVPGQPMYAPLGGVDLSTAFIAEQHRRLTQWEKSKNIRFMLRLLNNDPKANRWLDLYSRGQITMQQIFSMT